MEHWDSHFIFYDIFQTNFSRYLKMLEFHKSSLKYSNLILDSGAGTGNLTKELLKEGHEVVAIDNNEKSLNVLKEKCKNYKKLVICKSDLSKNLSFKNDFFNGIASCFVIPFIKNIEFYLSENYRVLKKNGIFSISALLPKKGLIDVMIDHWKKENLSNNLLKKYNYEYNIFLATSFQNQEIILRNGIIKENLINILKKIGFVEIKEETSSYDDYVAFIKCKK